MKALILFLMILIAVPATAHLPFAPKAKYGKVKTKKCHKPIRAYRIKNCLKF